MRTLSVPDMLYYIYEKNVRYDIQFRMEEAQQEFGCHDSQDIVKMLEKLLKSGLIAPLEGVRSAYRMTEKSLALIKGYDLPEDANQQPAKEATNE